MKQMQRRHCHYRRFRGSEILEPRRMLAVDLVADIAPGPGSSAPDEFAQLGESILFSAQDTTHGRELWSYDTSQDRARRVLDIRPGPDASDPSDLTPVANEDNTR